MAAPSVESRPSTTCAFSVVVNFGVFLVPGVVRAARTVQFAPDASAFNVTITALVINDNSPFLNINGVVIPMPLEHPDFPAHTLPLAISISSALRGGDNAFEGSFFNRFGAEGGMQIALAGSYSTREGCAGPVVR